MPFWNVPAFGWLWDLFDFSLVVSIGSAVIAFVSYREAAKARHHVAAFDAIERTYDVLHELNALGLEHWRFSHLLALPQTYAEAVAEVRLVWRTPAIGECAEFNVKERLVADTIFSIYERTLFQDRQARRAGHRERTRFFQAVLGYFTGRLLRNPRLLYYWPRLEAGFEPATLEHYRRHVLGDESNPLTVLPDTQGPLGSGGIASVGGPARAAKARRR